MVVDMRVSLLTRGPLHKSLAADAFHLESRRIRLCGLVQRFPKDAHVPPMQHRRGQASSLLISNGMNHFDEWLRLVIYMPIGP